MIYRTNPIVLGINEICNPRKHHLGRVEVQRPKLTILREKSHTTCEKKEGRESQKPEMAGILERNYQHFQQELREQDRGA